MGLEERVVLESVLGALDVDLLQVVGRILQLEVEDVLGGDAQVLRLRHAEELVDVGRVARADLQRAVDVRDAVGVTVHEAVDRDLIRVRQATDEAARGARRDTAHLDQDALAGLPELVVVQALEHTAGLDGDDELGVRLELEVLDRVGDGVGGRFITSGRDA